MKKLLVLIILIMPLLLTASVSAQESESEKEVHYGQLRDTLHPYLDQKLPGALDLVYGNEQVTFYLGNKSNHQVLGHLRTHKGKFTDMGPGKADKSSFNVYIKSEAVIEELLASDTPVSDLKRLKNEGKIKIEGVGFFNQLKGFFVSGVSYVLGIF